MWWMTWQLRLTSPHHRSLQTVLCRLIGSGASCPPCHSMPLKSINVGAIRGGRRGRNSSLIPAAAASSSAAAARALHSFPFRLDLTGFRGGFGDKTADIFAGKTWERVATALPSAAAAFAGSARNRCRRFLAPGGGSGGRSDMSGTGGAGQTGGSLRTSTRPRSEHGLHVP